MNGTSVLRHETLRSLRGIGLTTKDRERLSEANGQDAAAVELIGRLGAGASSKATGESREDLTPLNAWINKIEGPSDARAGERVFFHSKGPGCYRCHQIDGRGGQAGPDLTTLATATDRRKLVESIVAPSREIAPQFVPWSVARTDGTVFTGILLEQTADGVLVFADGEGRRIAIKPDEIAERKPQTRSIMPDDLPRLMTLQELRDLIAFLAQSAPKPNR